MTDVMTLVTTELGPEFTWQVTGPDSATALSGTWFSAGKALRRTLTVNADKGKWLLVDGTEEMGPDGTWHVDQWPSVTWHNSLLEVRAEIQAAGTEECSDHGRQMIVDGMTSTDFDGSALYWVRLECGCAVIQ